MTRRPAPRPRHQARWRQQARWRHRVCAAALLVASVVALGVVAPRAASAGPVQANGAAATGLAAAGLAQPATTTVSPGDAGPGIIPEPNSGHAPRDSGDRGGWMQAALFFVICGALLLIGLLVWRESRRKRGAGRSGRPAATRR
ncbi:MAG: hypothetical protein GEV08_02905 [Acidimicrobiia bacterium]|nr:hypothetical protein [Acidimicrobiia bacterium]